VSAASPRRSRLDWHAVSERLRGRHVATATLVAALCLAGCGSSTKQRAARPPPKLPRAVAIALASQSEAIAQALDAQDSCRASSLARVLQANTIAAINARHVPGPLQEPLASTVTDLVSRIRCTPPPVEERGPGRQGKGKAKGKHKHEGND
jgi:uncharacterized lipoprotein YajG